MNSKLTRDLALRLASRSGADRVSVEPMTGGHSGITLLATLHRGDREERLVVKAAPPGRRAVGRHDVLRQARIIEALAIEGSIPVAELRYRDDGDPPFFASSLLPGVATEPLIEPALPEESAALLAARWDAAVSMLADLHAVPLDAIALEDEPERQPLEELAVWTATMESARFDNAALATRLAERMRASAPQGGGAALVHGDFRLGNVLFEGAHPRGLIDWEIWSVGDPLVDLGWFVQFTDPDNYPGMSRRPAGTPSAEQVAEAYLERSGADRGSLPWFLALGCFKLAAIQAHNRRRHLEGRHHDPLSGELGPSVERLLERGLSTLEAA